MEMRLWLGIVAVLSAFACAYLAATTLGEAARRRRSGSGKEPGDGIAWRLRNGYGPLLGPGRFLLRSKRFAKVVGEFSHACSERGYATTAEPAASMIIAAALSFTLLVGIVTFSPIAALASLACFIALATVLASSAADKRTEKVRDAVPAAIESMSACFGSGFTLLQTFRQVADDTPGPLGKTFARCAHALEMGGSAGQVLAELRQGACASELAFVSVALDVQHQSGGAMQHVLDAAADTVKGELALRRSLRVQTAQAKLSARVVVIMPFILIAAFSLATPDFLMPFFSSPMGYALLSLAAIMQIAGIVLVRKALAVEGVS